MSTPAPPSVRRSRDLTALAVFLAICVVVYAANGAVTATSVGGWYQTLAKPPFNPPDWLFTPVWALLFILMAVAAWRVWRAAGWTAARPALAAWALQLGLNFTWSLLFFGMQAVGAALAEIGVLLAAILATTVLFWRHDRPAGLLFLPYLAWVAFAALLNASLWTLN